MSGTGDNQFSPLGVYTRQQAYVTMVRLYDAVPVVSSGHSSEHGSAVSYPSASGNTVSQPNTGATSMTTPITAYDQTLTITGTEARSSGTPSPSAGHVCCEGGLRKPYLITAAVGLFVAESPALPERGTLSKSQRLRGACRPVRAQILSEQAPR
jgi:hypothetical protein